MNSTVNCGFSRLGLGTGMLASLRGGLSFAAADRLVASALDHGVHLIDTADSYASGECERLLGRILKARSGGFTLMTKAGYAYADLPWPLHHANPVAKKLLQRFGPRQRFEPAYLQNAIRRSLQRLQLDNVGVFLLHDPPPECLADGLVFQALDSIKQQGLATMTGVSSGDEKTIALSLAWPGCDVIQTPLTEEGGLPAPLRSTGPGQVRIVLNHVSLGGRQPGSPGSGPADLGRLREQIARRTQEQGTSPHASLLAVALEASGADSVLTGTRDIGHLIENARAVNGLYAP
jgi:aryl-alcohol dehydrogenase-like predicted oxidoreductase